MFVIPYPATVTRTLAAPRISRALDRLFDDAFDRPTARTAVRTPAMDVSETDTAYHVVFDMPGIDKSQLKVTVEGRKVSIESTDAQAAANDATAVAADDKLADTPADATPAAPAAAERALYRERAAARYARTVVLPAEVDQSASQARFDNGVLTLTLAKRVADGARRIEVA